MQEYLLVIYRAGKESDEALRSIAVDTVLTALFGPMLTSDKSTTARGDESDILVRKEWQGLPEPGVRCSGRQLPLYGLGRSWMWACDTEKAATAC